MGISGAQIHLAPWRQLFPTGMALQDFWGVLWCLEVIREFAVDPLGAMGCGLRPAFTFIHSADVLIQGDLHLYFIIHVNS